MSIHRSEEILRQVVGPTVPPEQLYKLLRDAGYNPDRALEIWFERQHAMTQATPQVMSQTLLHDVLYTASHATPLAAPQVISHGAPLATPHSWEYALSNSPNSVDDCDAPEMVDLTDIDAVDEDNSIAGDHGGDEDDEQEREEALQYLSNFNAENLKRGAYHAHFVELLVATRTQHSRLFISEELSMVDLFLPQAVAQLGSSSCVPRLSLSAQALYARLFIGRKGGWLRLSSMLNYHDVFGPVSYDLGNSPCQVDSPEGEAVSIDPSSDDVSPGCQGCFQASSSSSSLSKISNEEDQDWEDTELGASKRLEMLRAAVSELQAHGLLFTGGGAPSGRGGSGGGGDDDGNMNSRVNLKKSPLACLVTSEAKTLALRYKLKKGRSSKSALVGDIISHLTKNRSVSSFFARSTEKTQSLQTPLQQKKSMQGQGTDHEGSIASGGGGEHERINSDVTTSDGTHGAKRTQKRLTKSPPLASPYLQDVHEILAASLRTKANTPLFLKPKPGGRTVARENKIGSIKEIPAESECGGTFDSPSAPLKSSLPTTAASFAVPLSHSEAAAGEVVVRLAPKPRSLFRRLVRIIHMSTRTSIENSNIADSNDQQRASSSSSSSKNNTGIDVENDGDDDDDEDDSAMSTLGLSSSLLQRFGLTKFADYGFYKQSEETVDKCSKVCGLTRTFRVFRDRRALLLWEGAVELRHVMNRSVIEWEVNKGWTTAAAIEDTTVDEEPPSLTTTDIIIVEDSDSDVDGDAVNSVSKIKYSDRGSKGYGCSGTECEEAVEAGGVSAAEKSLVRLLFTSSSLPGHLSNGRKGLEKNIADDQNNDDGIDDTAIRSLITKMTSGEEVEVVRLAFFARAITQEYLNGRDQGCSEVAPPLFSPSHSRSFSSSNNPASAAAGAISITDTENNLTETDTTKGRREQVLQHESPRQPRTNHLPSWLQHMGPLGVLFSVISEGVKPLEQLNRYTEAVELLNWLLTATVIVSNVSVASASESLPSRSSASSSSKAMTLHSASSHLGLVVGQRQTRSDRVVSTHRRGKWYLRLAIDLKHKGKKDKAKKTDHKKSSSSSSSPNLDQSGHAEACRDEGDLSVVSVLQCAYRDPFVKGGNRMEVAKKLRKLGLLFQPSHGDKYLQPWGLPSEESVCQVTSSVIARLAEGTQSKASNLESLVTPPSPLMSSAASSSSLTRDLPGARATVKDDKPNCDRVSNADIDSDHDSYDDSDFEDISIVSRSVTNIGSGGATQTDKKHADTERLEFKKKKRERLDVRTTCTASLSEPSLSPPLSISASLPFQDRDHGGANDGTGDISSIEGLDDGWNEEQVWEWLAQSGLTCPTNRHTSSHLFPTVDTLLRRRLTNNGSDESSGGRTGVKSRFVGHSQFEDSCSVENYALQCYSMPPLAIPRSFHGQNKKRRRGLNEANTEYDDVGAEERGREDDSEVSDEDEEMSLGGGWSGVHNEGRSFRELFALLMWPALFDTSVPDVFQTPFQAAPLDLDCASTFFPSEASIEPVRPELPLDTLSHLPPLCSNSSSSNNNNNRIADCSTEAKYDDGRSRVEDRFRGGEGFYASRRQLIDSLLCDLNSTTAPELAKKVEGAWHTHKGIMVRGLDWRPMRHSSLSVLQATAVCVGGPVLSTIFRALCMDYRHFSSGMPDLLLLRVLHRPLVLQPPPLLSTPSIPRSGATCGNVTPDVVEPSEWAGGGCALALNPMHIKNYKSKRVQSWQKEEDLLGVTVEATTISEAEDDEKLPEIRSEWTYEARFVEVKGPSDRLSEKQRSWIVVLKAAGASCRLCQVRDEKGKRKLMPRTKKLKGP